MPTAPPEVVPTVARGDLPEDMLQVYLRAERIAIDTETMGLQPLRDRLCLVQLCDRERRACLVQIPRAALSPGTAPEPKAPRLKRLLEDPAVLKVFHFARFDVATLRHHLGIQVDPLYCTRTASKLARTYTDRHGLKDVALDLLDVELDKVARHTDWSATDLTAEQLRYAVSDVTLLIPIMDRLEAMLAREGRTALARQCFRAIPTLSELDLLGFVSLFEH
jgi:ribonuclease D